MVLVQSALSFQTMLIRLSRLHCQKSQIMEWLFPHLYFINFVQATAAEYISKIVFRRVCYVIQILYHFVAEYMPVFWLLLALFPISTSNGIYIIPDQHHYIPTTIEYPKYPQDATHCDRENTWCDYQCHAARNVACIEQKIALLSTFWQTSRL